MAGAKKTAEAARILRAVYDACLGAASESDAFDGFYEGGTAKMVEDFASALAKLGIGPGEKTKTSPGAMPAGEARVWDALNVARYYVASAGIWVEDLPDDYGGGRPKGFRFETDGAEVRCPLAFQDWSGRSGLGMVVKIPRPGLGPDAVKPVVDRIWRALSGDGVFSFFSRPTVKPDPGPGAGKTRWFVRIDLAP